MNHPTSATWTTTESAGGRWLFPALLGLASVVTAAAVIAGNGNLAVAVAPALAFTVLCGMCFAPLRIPLLVLVFLGLALDASSEGAMDSPVAWVGHLLLHNLNKSVPINALALPLLTITLCVLLLIYLCRRLIRMRIDAGPAVWTRQMNMAMGLSLAAVLLECAWGSMGGGNMQMAKIQLQSFVAALLLAYLLGHSLRGTRDQRLLGAVVVAAACCKALITLFLYASMTEATLPNPRVVTSHGDSILFASGAVMVVAYFWERPNRRNALLGLAVLPLLAAAMVANNRRISWVEAAGGLVLLYLLSRRSPIKRFVTQAIVLSIPLTLLYIAAGWNSNSKVFAPVKVFRSVGDSQVDGSTMFRDIENFNLLYMLRSRPILGTGFGHAFEEKVVLPDISFYQEYHFMPHNSILGLWCFIGWLGFSGLSLTWVSGVFLAARKFYGARSPDERVAAFVAIAMILIYLIHCWGDIGFSNASPFSCLAQRWPSPDRLFAPTRHGEDGCMTSGVPWSRWR